MDPISSRWLQRSAIGSLLAASLISCGGNEATTSSAQGSSTSASSSGAGGGSGGGGSGGSGGGASFTTADHAPFPTFVNHGGPVLAHPHLVTITFAGYPFEAEVQSFGDWIATSSWLTETGKDYGISAGAHAAKVVLPDMPPATVTDDQTAAFLAAKIADKTLPDPMSLEDPLYVLYYPNETIAENFTGAPACAVDHTVGGYHWETMGNGVKFAYAVVPTCATNAMALEYLEASSAHEIIEAASDAYPLTDDAYALVSISSPWASALNGEIADFCQFEGRLKDSGFFVPRVWSNSAAKAGTDPCVPVPASEMVYYNTSPAPPTIPTVAAGQSTTFTITGWSTGPLDPWKLEIVSWGDFPTAPMLSAMTISNGETVTLTLSVPAGTPPGSQANALVYSIRDLKSQDYTYWPVVIRSK